ncbi:MAG: hypothetical protein ACRC33_23125, partial [Gemmataceae bacterium]
MQQGLVNTGDNVTIHIGVDRQHDCVLTRDEWEAEDRQGFGVPWVEFQGRSLLVGNIRTHLRSQSAPNTLHLAGLSGVGKTRTVLEACRGQDEFAGVLYVPRYEFFTERFLRQLTRGAAAVLVVIDEVPLEELRTFTSRVGGFAQRLRFVTIGPAHRNDRGRPSSNILMLPEPDTEEGVLQVVQEAGFSLPRPVLQSIARFASHDLRLALMLVEATREDSTLRDIPIEDGEEVWHRVTGLFRTQLGDLQAFRANYPYLTVAIDLGVKGEARGELEYIAKEFGVASARLDEATSFAAPCGLGVTAPSFFEPVPRALAGHLFRQRVWRPISNRLDTFLSGMPDRLLRRFIERCQECVGPERDEIEEGLARYFHSALGVPDVRRLADREASRLFKTWAELDPDRGLSRLRRAVEAASDGELAALTGDPDGSGGWRGRRQIVWLCEGLASFGDHFPACEAVLFRLAQIETEPSIGNNSTQTWRAMFHPVLAFTETPFPDRADLLLRRL